jgi:hypothetical protein
MPSTLLQMVKGNADEADAVRKAGRADRPGPPSSHVPRIRGLSRVDQHHSRPTLDRQNGGRSSLSINIEITAARDESLRPSFAPG